jgi:hypothetical protein
MQLKNYLMSEKKWRLIVAELKRIFWVDWGAVQELLRKRCGHCIEYCDALHNCTDRCTLRDDRLCGNGYGDYDILVNICHKNILRNKRKALRIAERIYKAVLLDDPRGGE